MSKSVDSGQWLVVAQALLPVREFDAILCIEHRQECLCHRRVCSNPQFCLPDARLNRSYALFRVRVKFVQTK